MRELDRESLDRLIPEVYEDLRRRAHCALSGGRPGDTLNTTDLVHETYLRFKAGGDAGWQDRAHFLAAAARAMRHIIVDYSRRRGALKRGGAAARGALEECVVGVDQCAAEILALDSALMRLGRLSPRLVRLVELRFFAGLSVGETADVLAVSERTLKRDWRKAKAFLHGVLDEGGEGIGA